MGCSNSSHVPTCFGPNFPGHQFSGLDLLPPLLGRLVVLLLEALVLDSVFRGSRSGRPQGPVLQLPDLAGLVLLVWQPGSLLGGKFGANHPMLRRRQ